jgi:hypothetical protein
MKLPHGSVNPEILDVYRETFAAIPGIRSVQTKPESGSIIIHYDPNRDAEFHRHFADACNQHLTMTPMARPDEEIDRIVNEIEAEAEFLAAHSKLAQTTVDFFRTVDRELKLATDNNIDLQVVLAAGLAAYTFLEVGGDAATPMWVTLALFALNHFMELHPPQAKKLTENPART